MSHKNALQNELARGGVLIESWVKTHREHKHEAKRQRRRALNDGELAKLFDVKISQTARRKSDTLGRERREEIRDAMKHTWRGYEENAYGRDELKPASGGFNDKVRSCNKSCDKIITTL